MKAADAPRATNEMVGQLTRLRRQIRALLVLDGLALLVTVGIGAFLALAAVDWWVHLPPALRLTGTIVALTGGFILLDRRVLRPLARPIGLREIASRVGGQRPRDGDRLASLVDHWERHAEGADLLWARVEDEALRDVTAQPLSSALSFRRPLYMTVAALVALGGIILVHHRQPSWTSTATARLVLPLSAASWPPSVEILPVTGTSRVARGEPFELAMRVVRGGSPSLRVFAVTQEEGARPQRAMMRLDVDGLYRRSLESVTRDLTFWFDAGDRETATAPLRLRVFDRPKIDAVRTVVTPPPYVADARPVVQSLDEGRLSVVAGSVVRVEVQASKPVGRDSAGLAQACLSFDDGSAVRLEPADDARTRLAAAFEARSSTGFDIEYVDQDGLAARPGRRYQLDVLPDEPPDVAVLQPAGFVEAAPGAELVVVVTADDEFGLTSVFVERTLGGVGGRTELLPAARREAGPRHRIRAEYLLRPADLKAVAGDVIEYRAGAIDNYRSAAPSAEGAAAGRDPVYTPTLRIQIVAESEMSDRLRGDLLALRNRLRGLLTDQEIVHDETTAVLNETGPDRPLSHAAGELVQRTGQRQVQLGTAAWQIATLLADLARRGRENRVGDEDLVRQGDALSRGVADVADGPMSRAAEALARVAEAGAAGQAAALGESAEHQAEAIDALRRMIASMERWNDVQDVVRRTRDLLDRQESLTRRSAEIGRRLAGAASDALSESDRALLRQAASDQDGLRQETEHLVRRLAELASGLLQRDRAAAEAMDRARIAADTTGLTEKMADAARDIGANRPHRAMELQRHAESALQTMIAVLEKAPDRQLEELSKQLQDVARRLQRLIDAQQNLIDANRAARGRPGAAIALRRLADRQLSIQSTTRQTARRLDADLAGVEAVQRRMRSAATHMSIAATRLAEAEGEKAESAQEPALSDLKRALEQLYQLEEQAGRELAERSLAAIREELAHLRATQDRLRTETQGIEQRRAAAGRLTRPDRVRLAGLSGEQLVLIESVERVRDRMLRAVVYRYVCDRIAQQMLTAAEALRAQRCVEAADQQLSVIRDLTRLIDALQREKDDARTQFAEAGGGGAGSPTPQRPVPPLAELKVLRLMQVELNDETATLAKRIENAVVPEEADLEAAEALGVRQREIRQLAEDMMTARSPDRED